MSRAHHHARKNGYAQNRLQQRMSAPLRFPASSALTLSCTERSHFGENLLTRAEQRACDMATD